MSKWPQAMSDPKIQGAKIQDPGLSTIMVGTPPPKKKKRLQSLCILFKVFPCSTLKRANKYNTPNQIFDKNSMCAKKFARAARAFLPKKFLLTLSFRAAFPWIGMIGPTQTNGHQRRD